MSREWQHNEFSVQPNGILRKADNRLITVDEIAATPELLAALIRLYNATPDCESGEVGEACRMARIAIDKAQPKEEELP